MRIASKSVLIAAVFTGIAIASAFTAGLVLADQYTYLGMDKYKQIKPEDSRLNTLPETYAQHIWSSRSGNVPTWWTLPCS